MTIDDSRAFTTTTPSEAPRPTGSQSVQPASATTAPAPSAPLNPAPAQQSSAPRRRVALDLDDAELERRHQASRPEPFWFRAGGHDFQLRDPLELDYQEVILSQSNPVSMLRLALPEDQLDAFFKCRIPVWKMRALQERYQKHYGLPDPGEAGALPA